MRTSSFRPAVETRYCFAAEYLARSVSFYPAPASKAGTGSNVDSRCDLADVYIVR